MAKQVILKDENNTEIYPESSTMVTRSATFTDILTVATSMDKYSGNWAVDATKVTGMPVSTGEGQLEVIPHTETDGKQSSQLGSFLYLCENKFWHGYVVDGEVTWNTLNTASQDGSLEVGRGDGSVAELKFVSDKAYAMLQMSHGSTANNNIGLAGTDGSMILGGGEGARSLFNDIINDGKASGTLLNNLNADGENAIIGSDTSVEMISNLNAYKSGIFDDVSILSLNSDGSIIRNGKDGKVTLMDSSGMLQGKARPIAANTDLNTMKTPGVYSTTSNANAATFKNGITDPSTQAGKAFNLTITSGNHEGHTVYQELSTLEGWSFKRSFYYEGNKWTPWIAISGTMHITTKGPFDSDILLLRSANTVTANIGTMTSPLAAGGTSTEKIPLDYVPMATRKDVSGIPGANLASYWANNAVAILKDGALHNYQGNDFSGDAIGTWLIQY